MVLLRDMIKSDIEDYVQWFTKDTEWCDKWDSPWEKIETTEEDERKVWTEYFNLISKLPKDQKRNKFEIESSGKHIGWVCCYYDLEYIENPDKILAIGIDISVKDSRGVGNGTEALLKFIEYLQEYNHKRFFIQTWSGNLPMIKVINKLGFKEYIRKENYRTVNNVKYDAITYLLIKE